jgi:DNA polymerase-1
MKPASKQAYALMHEGALALTRMEQIGMPIDVPGLDAAIIRIQDQIKENESALRDMPEYREQRKKYGIKAKIGSREQLADILYNVMGHENPTINPENGNIMLDDSILRDIGSDYTKLFQRTQKLHKLCSTYLQGIRKEVCGNRVHGFFNLHRVVTYRSSSDSPNLQNIPIRDPDIGSVIRSVIKPNDPNNVIVEIDYSALEVHIAACYHKDPVMIEYLETGHDLHRDMAIECYRLDKSEKPIRTQVKGLFVFAAFYGDYFASIARNLWKFAQKHTMESGALLESHLRSKGIIHLGNEDAMTPDSFMQHIHDVEKRFWEQRFPVYSRWRKDFYLNYLRNGHFCTHTGFRVWGVFKRNEVINSPVQGAAFHCLLKSIIQITKQLAAKKMKSRLFCQIHDSLLAEVPREELDDYIALATDTMTRWLRTQWPWIIVDLKTEVEVGDSWANKKPYMGKEHE